jgi:hypothetical protein
MNPQEHEFEAVRGLPEALPAGEHILWQGAPRWQSIARSAFHAGHLSIYFAVILAARAVAAIVDGGSATEAATAVAWLLPLALVAVGIFVLMGWLVGQTAYYTITSRRVVMRIGIVLTVTFNIPFRVIESAGLQKYADGTGDIALALSGDDRIAYLHLWPHVRPWHLKRPQPMLRSVTEATAVAQLLASAIAAAEGSTVRTAFRPVEAENVAANESSPMVATQ